MSLDPYFLSGDIVKLLHDGQVEGFGGVPGVRDENVLQSAVNAPQDLLYYGDPTVDIFDLAGCYAYRLATSHPFTDGNKRCAAAAADVFLRVNGWEFVVSNDEFEGTILRLAAGLLAEKELAAWYRNNSQFVSGQDHADLD